MITLPITKIHNNIISRLKLTIQVCFLYFTIFKAVLYYLFLESIVSSEIENYSEIALPFGEYQQKGALEY